MASKQGSAITLTPVRRVSVDKLQANAENARYFAETSDAEVKQLLDDIRARGIQVPLVAKSDGTLLAGHRRLLAARVIGITAVPVQYVQGKITSQQETEYIIKDNLLRRHLSFQERQQLYRKLIRHFDDRVMHGVKSGAGVSVQEVAEKTGLNPRTVNYDINRIRHQKKKELAKTREIDVLNDKAVENYNRAVARMLNTAIVEKGATVEAFREITKTAAERLEGILTNIKGVSA